MTRLMLSLCNTARCESSCSWKYGSSKIIENQRLFF